MAWFSSEVEVTLIDDLSGQTFAKTKMPPADLPESFELETTLHLGGDDWSVVDARPRTRAEYSKSKSLTLRLRRIEHVDPRDILYSLPSICDAIPAVGDQPLSGREFVLAEDDWRQYELVSQELRAEADEEIAKVRRIHETAAASVGWREIHVRSKADPPIVSPLTLTELANALGVPAESSGVTYHGAKSPIVDGYSFSTPVGLRVYGVTSSGNVQVIAFGQDSRSNPSRQTVDRLQKLAQERKLDLVQWCRCARIAPDDPTFASLLSNATG